jgi:hypothetical protein
VRTTISPRVASTATVRWISPRTFCADAGLNWRMSSAIAMRSETVRGVVFTDLSGATQLRPPPGGKRTHTTLRQPFLYSFGMVQRDERDLVIGGHGKHHACDLVVIAVGRFAKNI